MCFAIASSRGLKAFRFTDCHLVFQLFIVVNISCSFSPAWIIIYTEPEVLIGGNDFYAFPRLDSKGEKIAWIEWSHPNMPWDKTELWVGYISETG